MKKLLLLFVGTTVLFAFSGCTKDDETPQTPQKTNEEILVSTAWKVSAFTISPAYDWEGDGTLITNIYNTFEPCDKDDFYTFSANKTYTLDEGPTKCDPSNPQTYPGFWSMNTNQTQLSMDGEPWGIKSMSTSQMVLESSFEEDGTTYTFFLTYSKK